MKDLSQEQLSRVLKNWRDVCDKQKALEQCLLKIARHPEATPEQMESALVIYRRAYKKIREMEPQMLDIGMKYHREQYVAKLTLTEV
jgi:hypothetical protein